MLFPDCENIALEFDDLSEIIVKIDAIFQEVGDKGVFDTDNISKTLNVPNRVIEDILQLLVDRGLLQTEKYIICPNPYCESLNDYIEYKNAVDDGDEFECSQCGNIIRTAKEVIRYRIVSSKLPDVLVDVNYIDDDEIRGLPERLYIDDIDNFEKVKNIDCAAVACFLTNNRFLNKSEEEVQVGIEGILSEPMHQKDWAGELDDLYTSNIRIKDKRVSVAFALKGNGLKVKDDVLQIKDCGKNGDQILRLCRSPAQIFFIQYVGNISENVISDIEGKVKLLRMQGKPVFYCILNGQDTARLLHAYGKL